MILRSANADLKEQLQAAQQWQPVKHNFHCDDGKWRHLDVGDEDDDLIMVTNDNPQSRYNFVSITLPDNIRLCRKIQPAA